MKFLFGTGVGPVQVQSSNLTGIHRIVKIVRVKDLFFELSIGFTPHPVRVDKQFIHLYERDHTNLHFPLSHSGGFEAFVFMFGLFLSDEHS